MPDSRRVLDRFAVIAWGVAFFILFPPSTIQQAAVGEFQGLPSCIADSGLRRAVDQAALLGLATGLLLSGILADKLGRFRVLLWSAALAPLCAALGGLSFTLADFLLFRCLAAVAVGGILVSGAVSAYETPRAHARRNAFVNLWIGGLIGAMAAALLEPCVDLFSRLPYASWRLFFLCQAIPAAASLLVSRYHDEPTQWKVAVRDSGIPRRRAGSFAVLWAVGKGRVLIPAFLLAVFSAIGLLEMSADGSRFIRSSSRCRNESRDRLRQTPRLEAGLISVLVKYPRILDVRGLAPEARAALPETLNFLSRAANAPNDLPGNIVEAVLTLHDEKKTIDRNAILDKILVLREKRRNEGREPSAIPLWEVDRSALEIDRLLEEGDRALETYDIRLPDEASSGGAELWNRRLEVFQTLLGRVRDKTRDEYRLEEGRLASVRWFFGIAGVFVLLAGRNIRIPSDPARRLIPVALALAMALVWEAFVRSQPLSATTSILFAVLGASLVLPFLVDLTSLFPKLFKTSIRATACGFCFGGACVAAFGIEATPGGTSLLSVPICFAATIPWLLILSFVPRRRVQRDSGSLRPRPD